MSCVVVKNLEAEKRRRCEWTDGMMQYKVDRAVKVNPLHVLYISI